MKAKSVLALSQRLSGNALLALAFFLSVFENSPVKGQSCGSGGLAVQVLGSGGPELQDKRASTSYLIWDHGTARVIVDAGGCSALRFGGERSADVAGGRCSIQPFPHRSQRRFSRFSVFFLV